MRFKYALFVAEGLKTIEELLNSDFELDKLYTTIPFDRGNKSEFVAKQIIISEKQLNQISFLKTPNTALAIFRIPPIKPIKREGLILALDSIRDPGNLGTIIRLCDWFGIRNLVCSEETVDCYNPKVVQATMGSISRVNLSYLNLEGFIKESTLPVFGAFMEGSNVYNMDLPKEGILVMGNEANGISKAIESAVTKKISIPQFGDGREAESLNVATATAILLSEFRRG